jgi:hypothetical protein
MSFTIVAYKLDIFPSFREHLFDVDSPLYRTAIIECPPVHLYRSIDTTEVSLGRYGKKYPTTCESSVFFLEIGIFLFREARFGPLLEIIVLVRVDGSIEDSGIYEIGMRYE